jgi:hypothetical protein
LLLPFPDLGTVTEADLLFRRDRLLGGEGFRRDRTPEESHGSVTFRALVRRDDGLPAAAAGRCRNAA